MTPPKSIAEPGGRKLQGGQPMTEPRPSVGRETTPSETRALCESGQPDVIWKCRGCGSLYSPTPGYLKSRWHMCQPCITERHFQKQLVKQAKTIQTDRLRAYNRERMRRARQKPEIKPKQRANQAISRAVKLGYLHRPTGTNFHHPDYSRPYFGCWVTPREHRLIHVGRMECPPCHDYTEEIDERKKATI